MLLRHNSHNNMLLRNNSHKTITST